MYVYYILIRQNHKLLHIFPILHLKIGFFDIGQLDLQYLHVFLFLAEQKLQFLPNSNEWHITLYHI